MTETNWPALLTDLTAKRDALTDLIAAIETHFLPATASSARRNGNVSNAKKLRKRTDGRTDGRTEQSARHIDRRIGASLT